MWHANPPLHSAREVGEACAQETKNNDLASRLRESLPELEKNSLIFRQAASKYQLHDLKPEQFMIQKMDDAEMINLYSGRLGRKSGKPTGIIRRRLLESSLHGRCCYCQESIADTLDHFVPKSYIPSLAIEPWNLVPACIKCNMVLNQNFSADASEQMPHPYMLPEEGRWLYAEASCEEGLTIEFFANPSNNFPQTVKDQIIAGFNALKLRSRFAESIAPFLVETQSALLRNFNESSAEEVKEYLLEISDDAFRAFCGLHHKDGCLCRETTNSQRGALLEALAHNDEYCAGAFADA